MENNIIMKVSRINKSYDSQLALKNVNLEFRKNEVVLLVGPNGAGKTTLIEIVSGLRKADKGDVNFFGQSRGKIAVMFQENTLHPKYTVKDEIELAAAVFGVQVDIENYLDVFGLREKMKSSTRKLSGGMKRKLLLALTLLSKSQIIVLDEPMTGLDPSARIELWEVIKQFSRDKTLIISDHYLNDSVRYCNRIVFLYSGEVLDDLPIKRFSEKYNYTHVIRIAAYDSLDINKYIHFENKGLSYVYFRSIDEFKDCTELLNAKHIEILMSKEVELDDIYHLIDHRGVTT